MPSKKAHNRSKGCESSKNGRLSKSVSSLKGADADYDSADECASLRKTEKVLFGLSEAYRVIHIIGNC